METKKMTKPKEDISVEEIKKMRMVERLANMQLETQYAGLKKTGVNNFSNFTYFKLSDIEPWVTEICYKYRCTIEKSFVNEASLELVSWENEEDTVKTVLEYPEYVKLDRMNLVQSAGSYITFFTRYLYIVMFNISENEVIDSLDPNNQNNYPPQGKTSANSRKNNGTTAKPKCFQKVLDKCREDYPDEECNTDLLNKVSMTMMKANEITKKERAEVYNFIHGK